LQQKLNPNTKGGHNKETFMLNVNTFKKFCLHLFTFQTPFMYNKII